MTLFSSSKDSSSSLSSSKDSSSSSSLHQAVRQRNVGTIKKLLKKGHHYANTVDSSKQTPLHIAASEGFLEIVRLLVEDYKANIENRDKNGWTPLHCSCFNGNLEICEYLLERGASAFTFTNDGDTPLHSLVVSNSSSTNKELFQSLFLVFLRKGVQLDKRNIYGETPLHVAVRKGREFYVKLLLTHNADPNAVDNTGETPLHSAARTGNVFIARVLVESGSDPRVSGKEGTAAEVAGRLNQFEVVYYLAELERQPTISRMPHRSRSSSLPAIYDNSITHPFTTHIHTPSKHLPIPPLSPRSPSAFAFPSSSASLSSFPSFSTTSQVSPASTSSLLSSSPPSSFMIQQPIISEVRMVNILQRYERKNHFILYPDTNKKSKKYSRAKKKCQIPSTERILAFAAANTNPSNSLSKDVILFGLKGIYSYLKEVPHFTPYSVILETDMRKRNSNPNEIHVGFNKYCSFLGLTGEEALKLLLDLREAIQSNNNNNNNNSAASSSRLSCGSDSSSPYSSGVSTPLSNSLPEFPSVPLPLPLPPHSISLHHHHQQQHAALERQQSVSSFGMYSRQQPQSASRGSYIQPGSAFTGSYPQLDPQRQMLEQQAAMLALQLQQLQVQQQQQQQQQQIGTGSGGSMISPPLSPRGGAEMLSPRYDYEYSSPVAPSSLPEDHQQGGYPISKGHSLPSLTSHHHHHHHHNQHQHHQHVHQHQPQHQSPISLVPTSPASAMPPQQGSPVRQQVVVLSHPVVAEEVLAVEPEEPRRAEQQSEFGVEETLAVLAQKLQESGDLRALNKLMLHPSQEEAYNAFMSCLGSLYVTSLNTQDFLGRTPMHFAALAGNQQLFLCLHSLGADPTILDSTGKSPFRQMEEVLGYELDESYSRPVQLAT